MKRNVSLSLIVFLILGMCSCNSDADSTKKEKLWKVPAQVESAIVSDVTEKDENDKLITDFSEATQTAEPSVSDEEIDDNVTETTDEGWHAEPQMVEKTIKLSDGPLFVCESEFGFTLSQYSFEMHDFIDIFVLDNLMDFDTGTFELAYTSLDNNCFSRRAFDPTFERVAVSWYEGYSVNEKHVGWMDRSGRLTDVSEIFYEELNKDRGDFEKLLPATINPCFDSEGNFVFFDESSMCFIKYAVVEGSPVLDSFWKLDDVRNPMSITTEGISFDSQLQWYGLYDDPMQYYLDFDGVPHDSSVAKFSDGTYMLQTMLFGGTICDCVENSDGYEFFMIKDGAIYRGGTGVSPVINTYGYNEYPFWEMCTDETRISPVSDWEISEMAYGNGLIVFAARRGDEYSLFKVPYENGEVGKSELVTWIFGGRRLYCWPECDREITVYVQEYIDPREVDE